MRLCKFCIYDRVIILEGRGKGREGIICCTVYEHNNLYNRMRGHYSLLFKDTNKESWFREENLKLIKKDDRESYFKWREEYFERTIPGDFKEALQEMEEIE